MSLKIEGEVKVDSEPVVAAWSDKLFVGCEDGSIKSFDATLTPASSWAAHAVQPFALAAGGGRVYSASNDGGVRVWGEDGSKVTELTIAGPDVGTLRIFGGELYAGDEGGNVLIYNNNEEKARYNLLEEVKDIGLSGPFLFTVRDLDVIVTEIKPEESKTRFTTRHTMEGRAPLRVAGAALLAMARGGTALQLLDASVDTRFKKLHEVKVSDMIVTSLDVSGDFVWTAGWDGHVRRWRIAGDQLTAAGELNVGACVNALVATAPGEAYAVMTGGRIVRVKAD